MIRYDWTLDEVRELYNQPVLELIHQASVIHRQYHEGSEVQRCQLSSIKTGGCPEDCKYCSQSSHYQTSTKPQALLKKEEVLAQANLAKERGATRFCMGAAWRGVREGKQFNEVLEMIRSVADMGLEVCCTLGLLKNVEQAERLKEAGLYAYNHNLDSSEDYYKTIITTRSYEDRLKTLEYVRESGLTVCCGGIIGLGESPGDRLQLLQTLATMDPHPESVPINRLIAMEGTPLEGTPLLPFWDYVKVVALARILMPSSMVRLAAGRESLNDTEHALCFLAGANSIFMGEILLTAPNRGHGKDQELFHQLDLSGIEPYRNAPAGGCGKEECACL